MKHVTFTHSAWKPVTCAICRSRFAYSLSRTVNDKVDEQHAKEAAIEVKHQLIQALSEGSEAVPCPGCGRYQPAMEAELKAAHGAGLRALCSAGLAGSALLLGLFAVNQWVALPPDPDSAFAALRLVLVLWGVLGALALGSLLARSLFNPTTHSDLARARRLIERGLLRVEALNPAGAAHGAGSAAPGAAAAGVLGAAAATAMGFSHEASAQSHATGHAHDLPASDAGPDTLVPGDAAGQGAADPFAFLDTPGAAHEHLADAAAGAHTAAAHAHSVAAAPDWAADIQLDTGDLEGAIADSATLTDATVIPDLGDLDAAIARAVGLEGTAELAASTAEATVEVVSDVVKDALN
jgi:hypothetical protein